MADAKIAPDAERYRAVASMTVWSVRVALPDGWNARLADPLGPSPQWQAWHRSGNRQESRTPEGLLARVWDEERKRVERDGPLDSYAG
jgi:hypothetical protein